MSTDITVKSNTQLSAWGDFANDHLASAIAGDLVTFAKGDWRRGESKKEIGQNDTFLCNMMEIWTGWIRWEDGAAVEHRISRIVDFAPRIPRSELGYTDKGQWEADQSGNPKDPWSPTDRMIMRDVATDEICTFSTSSIGGRQAIAKLCQQFDRQRAEQNGQYPVVRLEAESYMHQTFGKIWKPKFVIVTWSYWDATGGPPAIAVTSDDPRTLVAQELNDEIPF